MTCTFRFGLAALLLLPSVAEAANRQWDLSYLRNAGTRFTGVGANDLAGRSVSPAGDVNGDGHDDFLVSAWNTGFLDPAGRVYLIYGGTYDLPPQASLSSADVILTGIQAGDATGQGLAAAGDVNGDGYDDVLIGAPRYDAPGGFTDRGRVYLIFGGPSLPSTIALASLTPSQGVIFEGGATGDLAGTAVAGLGDVDGDGVPDFLVGAPGAAPLGRFQAGQAHLVLGRNDFAAGESLSTVSECVVQGAAAGHQAGTSVTAAGDFDGDGLGDFALGAPFSNLGGANSGAVTLIFGDAALPASIDTAAALGSLGRAIRAVPGTQLGEALSGGYDVDGDGLDDLLLGAQRSDPGLTDAGRAWLIYGDPALATNLSVDTLGSAGVTFNGATANDNLGFAVAMGPDTSGDDRPDLLLGAQNGDGGANNAGETYLIYGGPALPATINLSNLSFLGIVLDGEEANDRNGSAVAFVGDVDGDGHSDIATSARTADFAGTDSGAVYLVGSACHRMIAEGSTAEGDTFTLKLFGPANAQWLMFLAPGALPVPVFTNKGPFWLVSPFDLGVFALNADGQTQLPISVPTGFGLSGLTAYWQAFVQPQGFGCDLSQLLATAIP